MASFSINNWFKTKCVNHTTPVKVVDSELGLAANGKPKYLKFTLVGDVEDQTSEGLAELALAQKAEVKVARDGAVLKEGTTFSRRAVTTGDNIAGLLLSIASGKEEEKKEEKKEEVPVTLPVTQVIRDNKLPETPKAPENKGANTGDNKPVLNGNKKQ
jgi:hypothetical protein